MRLAELFADVAATGVDLPEVCVSGVAIDSRQVRRGDLFLALAGAIHDGHDYIDAAIAAGAVAVASEREPVSCAVAQLTVADLAQRASQLAGALCGEPSSALQVIAVTGTNGKTSVAYYSAQLATLIGVPAGFIGTTGWGLLGTAELKQAELTTADAVTLQRRLAALRADGARLVALELSSHALAQYRADGVAVDVGVFTNLTRDHLDYHATMAAYGAAKSRLFEFAGLQHAVINADDDFGAELLATHAGVVSQTALGTRQRSTAELPATEAVVLDAVQPSEEGLAWELQLGSTRHRLQAPVYGTYNATNISSAVLALVALGYSLPELIAALPALRAPAGRLQRVAAGADRPTVFVDYAHTPHALETVLSALRPHTTQRLFCVFGCGGDRDTGKRVPMGQAASSGATTAWLTTDNPRSEDPRSIIDDVLQGLSSAERARVQVQPDRRLAIGEAIAAANAGDIVLIAGKGHETYQEVNGERLPFDDVAIAAAALGVAASDGGAR